MLFLRGSVRHQCFMCVYYFYIIIFIITHKHNFKFYIFYAYFLSNVWALLVLNITTVYSEVLHYSD